MYRYFVSFTCRKDDKAYAGNMVMKLNTRIDSMYDIRTLQEEIAKDNDCKEVIINNFILMKESHEDECLHCGEHKAKYCEKCFQDLISQIMKLQLELNDLKGRYHIPPLPHIVTSNPYVTTGPIYGIDYGEEPDCFCTWKPKENNKETKFDSIKAVEEYVKSKQKEGEVDGTEKENS